MQPVQIKLMQFFSEHRRQSVIPLFQRNYEWERTQWKDFWEALLEQAQSEENTHFMGTIVTKQAPSIPFGLTRELIIDGQQRLSTFSIFLTALRDEFRRRGKQERASEIQRHYLVNENEDAEGRLKLVPSRLDRAVYSKIVRQEDLEGEEKVSRLARAKDYFDRELRKLGHEDDSDDDPDDTDEDVYLEVDQLSPERLLAVAQAQLKVVAIQVDDRDDPYAIYNTLNAKGKPLSQADLIRNLVLMQWGTEREQERIYEDLWLPIEKRLRSGDGQDSLTPFFWHQLGTKREKPRKDKVYVTYQQEMARLKRDQLEEYVRDLRDGSARYEIIVDPEKEPDSRVRRFLAFLLKIKVTVPYPVLLLLYERKQLGKIDADQFRACVEVLESFLIRRMICAVRGNVLSVHLPQLCKALRQDDPSDHAAWMKQRLAGGKRSRRWPGDNEFREELERQEIYGRKELRYVLECIEESFKHKEPPVLGDNVSIEHILPQNPSEAWLQVEEQTRLRRDQWLHRLGNLTLSGYNSELGNKSFEKKREDLLRSNLEMNKSLKDYAVWDEEAIRKRTRWLADRMIEIWPGADDQDPASASSGKPRLAARILNEIGMGEASLKDIAAALDESLDAVSEAVHELKKDGALEAVRKGPGAPWRRAQESS